MRNLLKRLALSFLSFAILFFSFVPFFSSVNAQDSETLSPTWYNSSFSEWYGKVYDPENPSEIFGERYTAAQVQWVIYGLWGFLINTATGPQNAEVVKCFMDGAADIETCTDAINALVEKNNNSTPIANSQNQEPDVWSLIFLSDRPLSGVSYVREKIQKFSLVPTAHAQTVGFGFKALDPVQGMWRAFRDIAFGLFVLIAIVFAFMIMFRVKLSPQMVISVQSALPKIIGALILVTFSYAIAGFLVDLMYVVIGLLSFAAQTIWKSALSISAPPSAYFNFMTLGQPLGNWQGLPLVGGISPQFGVMGLVILFFIVFFLPLILFLAVVGAPLAIVASSIWFVFVGLIFIVAVIIALWTGIKVIWSLLKAFVNVLLLTIFAPIQIAAGTVVPSFGFGQWVRSYVANLSVFVVTGALFMFSFLFIAEAVAIGFRTVARAASFFLGPLLGNLVPVAPAVANPGWPPLLGTGQEVGVALLFLGVSFVLFTLTPKAAEIIQSLLSGKPFAYGTAIGEAFGGVGLAYGATGARDVVETAQLARRMRMLDRYLGQSGPIRTAATWLIGGPADKAGTTLDSAVIEKKSVGKQRVPHQ